MNRNKRRIVLAIIAITAATLVVVAWSLYSYFSVKVLNSSQLLPEDPLAYARVNDIIQTATRLQQSEFWAQFLKTPAAKEIQDSQFWQNVQNSKSALEYNIGQELDLAQLRSLFNQEVIVSLYRNEKGTSFLLLFRVPKGLKIRTSLLELKDLFDDRYKLSVRRYGGFKVVDVDGMEHKFSYTLIGMTAAVSASSELIKSVIDVHKGQAKSFKVVKFKPGGTISDPSAKSAKNEIYLNLSRYPSEFPLGNLVEKLSKSVSECLAVLSFEKSTLTVKQFMATKSPLVDRLSSNFNLNHLGQTQITSWLLPESLFISSISQIESETLWRVAKDSFSLKMVGQEGSLKRAEISDLVERGALIAILPTKAGDVSILPHLVIILKAKDNRILSKTLDQVKVNLRIGNRALRFEEVQRAGSRINVAYIPLGLTGHVKGGYSVIGDLLVISTNIRSVEMAIDASREDGGNEIANSRRPVQSSEGSLDFSNSTSSSNSLLFLQSKLPELVAEVRKVATFVALDSILSGEKVKAELAAKISDNISPLETLQRLSFQLFESPGSLRGELSIESKPHKLALLKGDLF